VSDNQNSRTGTEARPRFDAALDNVKRRLRPTLVPRPRQASDGTFKVVANPRISAGSTVEINGPASVPLRDQRQENDAM
jgi:hypothetical protein